MEQELTKAFKCAICEPDPSLSGRVWNTLISRNERRARLKLLAFSLVGLASFGGLIPAGRMLTNDFTRSGFYEYISLAFSNGGSLATYWREFIFTILESLPFFSIILLLALVFVFFLSIKLAVKQISKNALGVSRLTLVA